LQAVFGLFEGCFSPAMVIGGGFLKGLRRNGEILNLRLFSRLFELLLPGD
jgi:hypothetical protein